MAPCVPPMDLYMCWSHTYCNGSMCATIGPMCCDWSHVCHRWPHVCCQWSHVCHHGPCFVPPPLMSTTSCQLWLLLHRAQKILLAVSAPFYFNGPHYLLTRRDISTSFRKFGILGSAWPFRPLDPSTRQDADGRGLSARIHVGPTQKCDMRDLHVTSNLPFRCLDD